MQLTPMRYPFPKDTALFFYILRALSRHMPYTKYATMCAYLDFAHCRKHETLGIKLVDSGRLLYKLSKGRNKHVLQRLVKVLRMNGCPTTFGKVYSKFVIRQRLTLVFKRMQHLTTYLEFVQNRMQYPTGFSRYSSKPNAISNNIWGIVLKWTDRRGCASFDAKKATEWSFFGLLPPTSFPSDVV